MMAEVVTQAHEEALPQEAGTCSLLFPFSPCLFFFFFFFAITLSVLVGADASTKESELTITEKVKGPAPGVQTTETQTGIPHTIQRPKSPPVPEGKDTTMEEAQRWLSQILA